EWIDVVDHVVASAEHRRHHGLSEQIAALTRVGGGNDICDLVCQMVGGQYHDLIEALPEPHIVRVLGQPGEEVALAKTIHVGEEEQLTRSRFSTSIATHGCGKHVLVIDTNVFKAAVSAALLQL